MTVFRGHVSAPHSPAVGAHPCAQEPVSRPAWHSGVLTSQRRSGGDGPPQTRQNLDLTQPARPFTRIGKRVQSTRVT